MTLLDWVFVTVLMLSMLLGAWRGLVFEVLSLVSWVAAFVLARWLAADLAPYLPLAGAGESVRYGAAFVLVFVLAMMLGGLLAVLFKKLTTHVGLRPVDRVLGAAFGAMRGVLLLMVATVLVAMTPLRSSAAWQASTAVAWSLAVIQGVKPAMPSDMGKYLPA